ncbi:hypothetical protein BRAS3809_3420012 [Bradyrhizobium sp. STM 3809]|nr:hypothetical protein BRAS3809_3420012 [Bradyrhizobium sp. STM 3809]
MRASSASRPRYAEAMMTAARAGGDARSRRREVNWLPAVCLVLSLALPSAVVAEDMPPSDLPDQPSPDSTISRDAWRQKVQQARERAEQARRDAAMRSWLSRYVGQS